jgi:NAD(P)H dehydrogenase (quinone)
MQPVNAAVIYYSATGTVHALAQAAAEAAEKASHVAGDGPPGDVALGAAGHQARRAVDVAAALKIGRAA